MADADPGIVLQQIDKGFDEAWGDLDIRVDDEEIVGVDAVEAEIIAAGEAFVIGHGKGVDHWKAVAEHFDRAVGGVIVDYVYFFVFICCSKKKGEESFEVESGIPIQDDECNGGAGFDRCKGGVGVDECYGGVGFHIRWVRTDAFGI